MRKEGGEKETVIKMRVWQSQQQQPMRANNLPMRANKMPTEVNANRWDTILHC